MATIRIIVDDPSNGRKGSIDVPDNMEADQLATALARHFNLPLQSGTTFHHYKLVRAHSVYPLKDTDTLKDIHSVANELYVLLLEEEVTEYIQELRRDQLFHIPSFSEFLFGLILGSVFIVFSFPNGVTSLGNLLGWPLMRNIGMRVGSLLDGFFLGTSGSTQQMARFNNLWLTLGIALLVYLVALTSLSLRHGRFDLFGLGSLFFFIGAACLQIITWIIYLIGWVLYIVFFIVGWIFRILGYIVSFLFHIIGFLVGGIWWLLLKITGFLLGSGWWLFALLLIVIVGYLAVRYRTRVIKPILWILGISGAIYLLIKLFPFLQRISKAIGQFLAPVLAFIRHAFAVIFPILILLCKGLLALFVIYGAGALLIDQFKGAWKSGNGRRGVILGALSIGTSLALVLLETNFGSFVRFPFFPPGLSDPINMIYQRFPIFDIMITLLVVIISIVGILRNLAKLRRGPGWREFQMAMVITTPLAIMVGILMLIVQRMTHDN
jgi:hypothetical protein